jgi:hypothetical protein
MIKLFNNLVNLIRAIKDELYYACKTIRSILSGYIPNTLELRDWDNDGEFFTINILDDIYDPYYVCPRFNNGRHIPLPLLLDESSSDYYLQKIIIRFFKRHTALLDDAIWDCDTYVKNVSITMSQISN